MLVFVRDMSEPLTGLVKKIDATVRTAQPKYAPKRKLGTFVIVGDAPGRADQLRNLAKQEKLTHVTFAIAAAPPRYEINPAADVTVVIYTPGRPGQNVVTANFALRECQMDEDMDDEIIAALAKMLPK